MMGTTLNHNRQIWLPLLLLGSVSFFIYANTLGHEFVYDDDVQILRNPWIRSPEHIPKYFTGDVWSFRNPGEPKSNYYRPVQLLAYLGLYRMAGLNPFAYHLANVLLHVACTLLVFLIARSLLHEQRLSLVAALLFAAHPVHTEAVAWVAANTELLCALFYFLAFGLFLYSLQPEKKVYLWLAVSVAAYFLSLLSKEMALTLPIVVFLYSYLVSESAGQFWRSVRSAVPYLVCTGIYLLARILALGFLVREQNPIALSVPELVLSIVALVGSYVKMLVLPLGLTAYHVFQPTRSPTEAAFLSAVLVVTGLSFALFRMRRRSPLMTFAGSWILLTLLPVLNPQAVGSNVFTERYLYIPSFGFVLVAVLLAKEMRAWMAKKTMPEVWVGRLGWVGLLLILIPYGFQTVARSADWRDNLRLYESAVRVSPNAPLMHNNLAQVLHERGDWEKARGHYKTAIDANLKNRLVQEVDLANSHVGLATVLAAEGRWKEAEKAYRQTLARFPNALGAYIGLANILFFEKRYQRALDLFVAAVETQPKDETLWHNRGVAHLYLSQFGQAVECFRKALEIYPYYTDAWNNLAVAYLRLGRYREAEQAAQTALRFDPANRNSRHFLGLIYYESRNWEAAKEQFQYALKDKPEDATIPYHLAVIHQESGSCPEAIPYFEHAIRLQPGFVEALYRLAVCERSRGSLVEAQNYLERIRSLHPTHALARNELGEIYLSQGRRADAEAEFQAALKVQPSLERARQNLQQLRNTKPRLRTDKHSQ